MSENEVLETPEPPWLGLHLVRLAEPAAKPVIRLVVDLAAGVAITGWRLERLPGADWVEACSVSLKLGIDSVRPAPAAAAPEPSIDNLRILLGAVTQLLNAIESSKSKDRLFHFSPEYRQGYRAALEQLRKCEQFATLDHHAAELRNLLFPTGRSEVPNAMR